jgi:hypothetical protein
VVGGGVGAVEVLESVGPKPGEEFAFLKRQEFEKQKTQAPKQIKDSQEVYFLENLGRYGSLENPRV